MAPLRTYLLPAMAAVAAVSATGLDDALPGCATKCVTDTIEKSSTCDPDAMVCVCSEKYSLKVNSEKCIQDACGDDKFGEAMQSFDDFCKQYQGQHPKPTTTFHVPPHTSGGDEPAPTTETTADKPPPETTADKPTSAPSKEPTTAPEEPTTAPTTGLEIPDPTTTPGPGDGNGGGNNGGGNNGGGNSGDGSSITTITGTPTSPGDGNGGSSSDGGSSPSSSSPPEDAGVRVGSSFVALVGGFLVATFFGF